MKYFILSLFVSLGSALVNAQDYINFYPWTSGSATGTTTSDPDLAEFGVKTGCITATTTVTNSGGAFQTSNPQFTSSYGTTLGLRIGINWTNISQTTTVTIDLRKSGDLIDLPVQFNIYDINAAACGTIGSPILATNKFIDVVSVIGHKRTNATTVNTGVTYNPNSMTNVGSGNIISGNTITGSSTGGGNLSSVVTFSTSICRIVITYRSGTGTPPGCVSVAPWPLIAGDNPRAQEIAISPLLITHDCTLPVEFGDFNANCNNDNFEFQWNTLTERNNDKFQIHGSDDAQNYNLAAEIPGAGNSSESINYSYLLNSGQYIYKYYRLSQIDYDGTTKILKTIWIDNSCFSDESDFEVYPSPFANDLKIISNNVLRTAANISVYNIEGRLVN